MRAFLIFVICLFWSIPALGQSAPPEETRDLFESGLAALESGDVPGAENYFKRAVSDSRTAAQAHFQLAKLYLDQDNAGAAHRHLSAARDLEPDNVEFITERIRQLRSGFSFFGVASIREHERARLGLLLSKSENDSLAALGFQEIGEVEARIFERYRSGSLPPYRKRADASYQAGITALNRALSLDPTQIRTYRELIKLYFRRSDMEEALVLTNYLVEQLPEVPESWLLCGLVQLAVQDYSASLACSTYGMDMMSDEERAAFDALELLFMYEDRDQFKTSSWKEKKLFWKGKDPRRLTAVNEREASHYARITYADLFFPKWRWNPNYDEYITPGEVILRYGLPRSDFRQVATYSGSPGSKPIPASMTLAVGSHRFQFEDIFSSGEWVIPTTVDTPGDAIGAIEPPKPDAVTDSKNFFTDSPDAVDPPGKQPFAMPYLVSGFRSSEGAEIVVAYGIPIQQNVPGQDVPVFIATGVYLIDDSGISVDSTVQSHSSLAASQIRHIPDGALWTAVSTFDAGQGSFTIQVEAESAQLVSYSWGPYLVQEINSEFAVSDPLLATGVEESLSKPQPGELSRNGFLIRPVAARVFSRTAPIHVYYEAYNLEPDSSGIYSFQTNVVLEPVDETPGVFGRLKDFVSVDTPLSVAASFRSQVSKPNESTYHILDLSGHEPGAYRLVLQLRDVTSGKEASSEQVIILE